MQQIAAGPTPPAREAPSLARIRRSSVPTASYRNVLEAALKRDDSDAARTPTPLASSTVTDTSVARRPSARKELQHEASRHSATARGSASVSGPAVSKVTRQGSLFASQEKKRERTEQSEVIAALQQNGAALSALNEREKARNEQLRAQVEQLQTELSRLKGMCVSVARAFRRVTHWRDHTAADACERTEALDEEKTKNEKITALRQHKGSSDYSSGSYLPDIHGLSSSAAAAAALQQQAQLEISYQRRVRPC